MNKKRYAPSSFSFIAATLVGMTLFTTGISATAQDLVSGPDRLVNRICTNSCEQERERLAVDSNGSAISIWAEEDKRIVTAAFHAATGTWAAPVTRFTGELVGTPEITIDGNGNALAIWATPTADYVVKQVWFARYISAQGSWTSPAKAFTMTYLEQLVDLAGSKNGNAIAKIIGRNGADNARAFNAATNTWGTAGAVIGDEVVLDPAGNAFATYNLQGYSYDADFYVGRYDAETRQYSGQILLDEFRYNKDSDEKGHITETSGGFRNTRVTVDAYGNAMVVWTKSVTTIVSDNDTVLSRKDVDTIKSARYVKSRNSWVVKSIPAFSSGKMMNMSLSTDRFANVTAVWTQYVGAYARVVSARYSAASGTWSTPRVIQSGQYNSRDATVGTDPQGNVFASWSQRTDSGTDTSAGKIHRTTVARYDFATGAWGMPYVVQDANRNGYRPWMGVDNKGRALLVWTQDSGRLQPDGSPVKEMRSDRVMPQ